MTPGTLIEEELLGQEPNYLGVLYPNGKQAITMGLCDLSTGEILLQTFDGAFNGVVLVSHIEC